jgi:HEAT repeat protein
MRRHRPFASLASLVCALSLASLAHAEPLPLTRDVQLGRPARAQALRVEVRDAAVRVRLGAAEIALPLETATDATVEEVALAGGATVVVVRVRGEAREAAALFAAPGGRPRMLWSGRTDLHGDPGERRAEVVEVGDRTGDGAPEVLVAAIAESTRICGTERTLLFPRAVEPQSQTLRPVVLFQVPSTGAPQELVATAATPGPTGAPLVQVLRFVGASSQDGAGEDVSAVGAPRMLEHPDASYWAEGRGGSGRGEFVTARREASGFAIRAFAITPAPADAAAQRLGRPKVLWLVGDAGERLRVTLPEDAALHPGQRYWVVPREPLPWTCVSVVLDEAYLPTGTQDAATRTALAGLEVYTDLDFGGGVEQLVRALVGDGPDSSSAADLLARLGTASIAPTRAAWARMSSAGRKRAVRVFAASARATDAMGDEARAALVAAASDEDADVRSAAISALAQAGEPAIAGLARVLGAGGAAGDAAALALGTAGSAAIVPLLAAVDAEGGTDRAALRDSLAAAVRTGREPALAATAEWLAASPRSVSTRAAIALALSIDAAPLVARLVSETASEATDFAARYRFILAAAHVPAEDTTDAWLASVAHDAPEWMLRAEALDALAARHSPTLLTTARTALADPYPRVRLAALHALAGSAEDLERIATLARRDPWPFVRAEAVLLLAPHARARAVIRAALGDPKESVRAAAIAAIGRANDRGAWSLVAARLANDDEWPVVISAGLELARARCSEDAHDGVMAVLQRGLREDAWAPDAELAVLALETAVMIGGELATDAWQVAERGAAPEALRAAARRLREQAPRTCVATP